MSGGVFEAVEDVKPAPRVVPPIQRASVADINELGEWLIPLIADHWVTTPQLAKYWLSGAIPSNEQALVRCGNAIGMAHVEPGRMGHPCRVIVDFVLSKDGAEGEDECVDIFQWLMRWAKGLQASGLFRVDDFTHATRSAIRERLGKLIRKESHNRIFD